MPVLQFNEHLHCPCKSPTIPPTCFSYVSSTYPNKLNEQINNIQLIGVIIYSLRIQYKPDLTSWFLVPHLFPFHVTHNQSHVLPNRKVTSIYHNL